VDDARVFVAIRRVITCDPKEVVLDNQLGEDHFGLRILYCPNDVSIVMTI
jgi:hypothetical protein